MWGSTAVEVETPLVAAGHIKFKAMCCRCSMALCAAPTVTFHMALTCSICTRPMHTSLRTSGDESVARLNRPCTYLQEEGQGAHCEHHYSLPPPKLRILWPCLHVPTHSTNPASQNRRPRGVFIGKYVLRKGSSRARAPGAAQPPTRPACR